MVYTGKSVSSFFLCWFFVLRVCGDFSRCMDALFAASAGVRIVLAAGAWARCFLFCCECVSALFFVPVCAARLFAEGCLLGTRHVCWLPNPKRSLDPVWSQGTRSPRRRTLLHPQVGLQRRL